MLKEKLTFKEEIPVNVLVTNIREYPVHFHDDLEIAYVLAGTVKLKGGYNTYTLKQGDIFIMNDRELHGYYSTGEDNIVMLMQLDISYFSRYYNDFSNCLFATHMNREDSESLEIQRNLLARIVMEMQRQEYKYEDKVIEHAHNLISCLMSDFRYSITEGGRVGRLHRITDFMYENYARKLTLGEIAKREHLSIFYLSHAIKESTGINFQELLNFIRVEESEKLLLGTNKKIGAISRECGFSALRYYIKHFEKWFDMPPGEYRKRYTIKAGSREIPADHDKCSPIEVEEAIKRQSKGIYYEYISEGRYEPEIIDIDIAECMAGKRQNGWFPEELFENDVMKAAARPFNLFKSLNESVIFSNRNCMVSASANSPSGISNLSVLLYNCDDDFFEQVSGQVGKEGFIEKLRAYDNEAEIIVRCKGISGEFKVVRYRMTKQNMISASDEWAKPSGTLNKRQALLNSWNSLPNIEVGEVMVSETLNLRVRLRGPSAELILIDRK